ncbi:hypothetical protein BD626DRAFT_568230 [Schizophyllum amplum]|uniref:Uncharacterized protein n=1 Tax=Schizophyllum amplum TaxID=97359 RepID=A0A550CID6_9AGAR|nr:hypothetical protein BD626DRAFT_568230 [Auriculariopsis ampla]
MSSGIPVQKFSGNPYIIEIVDPLEHITRGLSGMDFDATSYVDHAHDVTPSPFTNPEALIDEPGYGSDYDDSPKVYTANEETSTHFIYNPHFFPDMYNIPAPEPYLLPTPPVYQSNEYPEAYPQHINPYRIERSTGPDRYVPRRRAHGPYKSPSLHQVDLYNDEEVFDWVAGGTSKQAYPAPHEAYPADLDSHIPTYTYSSSDVSSRGSSPESDASSYRVPPPPPQSMRRSPRRSSRKKRSSGASVPARDIDIVTAGMNSLGLAGGMDDDIDSLARRMRAMELKTQKAKKRQAHRDARV